MAVPAHAQLDIGRIIDLGKKAVEVAPQIQQATKEYTVEEEVALGEGIASGFLGAIRLHGDERLQRYVNRVGRWLASQTERPDLPWAFGVIDTDTINAFAMPGGTVIVSHGLVKRLDERVRAGGRAGPRDRARAEEAPALRHPVGRRLERRGHRRQGSRGATRSGGGGGDVLGAEVAARGTRASTW